MKVNFGFVSNSSTSSFVVIGGFVDFDKDNEDWEYDLQDDGFFVASENSEDDLKCPEGKLFVGVPLQEGEYYDWDAKLTPLADLSSFKKQLVDAGLNVEEFFLATGIRAC